MIITVYTVVTNDDNGINTSVYTTRSAADTAARSYLQKYWDQCEMSEPMPDSWQDAQEALSDIGGFIDSIHVDEHPTTVPDLYYVTMTWDNWPEGGSYGTIVRAHSREEAEELCRQEMAQTRVEEDDDVSEAEIRRMYDDDWHVVDCFPLDQFIYHAIRK